MKYNFRDHHLLQLLAKYDEEDLRLDILMNLYFRHNKALGSKDRQQIGDLAYDLVRWKGTLDHFLKPPYTWEKRYELYQQDALASAMDSPSLPPHIRVSFPKPFFDCLKEAYGEERAIALCLASNTRAPITVRVNTLKIDRDTLLERWKGQFQVKKCTTSPCGIQFLQKILFSSLPEHKEGLFEVQDEGSQLIAQLVSPPPGSQILDYCAGAGGKSLALASTMEHKGQLYLYDIRPAILYEAKRRLKRAGIQNFQLLLPESKQMRYLKGKMDAVLVDAPCSGSGTLRRNPDLKWNFSKTMLDELVAKQRMIFAEALSYLKPGGKIIYATCSIFPEENEQQLEYFQKTHKLKLVGEPLHTWPEKGGMDGFFGIVLTQDLVGSET